MILQIVKIIYRTPKRIFMRLKYGKPVTLEQIQAHLDSISVSESEKRDLERLKRYFADKEFLQE